MVSPVVYGLVSGSAIPPLVTLLYLRPKMMREKYNELDLLRYKVDFVGWNLRQVEEKYGVKHDDLYTPDTFYQSIY